MLDSKEEYRKAYARYKSWEPEKLQEKLGELHKKVYEEHEIELLEEYRLVSRIYHTKTRTGTGLIFHLKKFCPVLL